MNIKIINAKVKHIEECIEILQNSDLGRTYFTNREKAEVMLTNGISKTGVSVAIDENEKILGFIYYMPNGVFGSYPYLHIIAVKEEYRNLGIGKQMMKYFEENASDHTSTKCFLPWMILIQKRKSFMRHWGINVWEFCLISTKKEQLVI